jgi:hypothetical protein
MGSWNERKLFFPPPNDPAYSDPSTLPPMGTCRVTALTSRDVGAHDGKHFVYLLTSERNPRAFPLVVFRREGIFAVDARLLYQFLSAPLESFAGEAKGAGSQSFAVLLRDSGVFGADPVFNDTMATVEILVPLSGKEPHRVHLPKSSAHFADLRPFTNSRTWRPAWISLTWKQTPVGNPYLEITGLVRSGWWGEPATAGGLQPDAAILNALDVR